MGYLDKEIPQKKLFTPPSDSELHLRRRDEQAVTMWNAFGHKKMSDDFSDMETPQEREDRQRSA